MKWSINVKKKIFNAIKIFILKVWTHVLYTIYILYIYIYISFHKHKSTVEYTIYR